MSVQIALNAHLLSAQASYRSAGIHGSIYNTLRYLPLAQADWHFHVLVGEGQPPEHPNIHVHRSQFKTTSPIKRILWEQIWQPQQLKRLAPHIYHSMAYVLPYRLKIPSVVTVHDLSFFRYPAALSRTRRFYLQKLTRASCQQAQRILAVSESTARDVSEILGVSPDKIRVVYAGVDEGFRPLAETERDVFRAQYQLPECFFLHLGTLEPRKNLAMLLRAYAALPADLRAEVHLVLAGGLGWDYADIFQTIERFDLAKNVHLLGYVPSEDLPALYNAALALVYPSVYEGWGLPVVEAMACGCPTLVSDVSSLPEAAGDTGLLIPPHDESAWTQALSHAIQNSAWREKSGQAGIQRAKGFTWLQTAQKTAQIYQELL